MPFGLWKLTPLAKEKPRTSPFLQDGPFCLDRPRFEWVWEVDWSILSDCIWFSMTISPISFYITGYFWMVFASLWVVHKDCWRMLRRIILEALSKALGFMEAFSICSTASQLQGSQGRSLSMRPLVSSRDVRWWSGWQVAGALDPPLRIWQTILVQKNITSHSIPFHCIALHYITRNICNCIICVCSWSLVSVAKPARICFTHRIAMEGSKSKSSELFWSSQRTYDHPSPSVEKIHVWVSIHAAQAKVDINWLRTTLALRGQICRLGIRWYKIGLRC